MGSETAAILGRKTLSQMDRRQALKFLAALGATGLATACSTEQPPAAAEPPAHDDPVRIGMIAPLSGGYKSIGDELVNGFQLFLDLNDRRLGDHPADLVTADEGETVQAGKAALDSLLKQNVLALTGVATSAVMLGIRDAVEHARIPLVGSNASPSALQSVVYIWRTSYVNSESGQALGPYVAERVPASGKVVIIAADNAANRDIVEGFQKGFGPSDPRLSEPVIWTDPSGTANASKISQLISLNPDAVFCSYVDRAATTFLKQLYGAGFRKQVYGPGFLTEGSVLPDLKSAEAQGILTALNYSTDLDNAVNREFAAAYRRAHGTPPTTYAMASYDAAQVLDKAIRLVGAQPSAQQVNLALGKVGQIDSPRGPWQFNQPRTPQQKWYLRRVQPDGQVLSNVLISELATLG
jgi:branched-chain amino acid transport system substrate-binding protein